MTRDETAAAHLKAQSVAQRKMLRDSLKRYRQWLAESGYAETTREDYHSAAVDFCWFLIGKPRGKHEQYTGQF